MDPLQAWLDAKEVRRMAEGLMAPAPQVDKSAMDAGYGDSFEGFASQVAPAHGGEPGPQADSATGPAAPSAGMTAEEHERRRFFRRPAAAAAPGDQDFPLAPGSESQGAQAVQDPEVAGQSQRAVAEHSLADARRVAQDSGMLGAGQSDAQSPAVAAGPEPPSLENDSPFKISAAQIHAGTQGHGSTSAEVPAATPQPAQAGLGAPPQQPPVREEAVDDTGEHGGLYQTDGPGGNAVPESAGSSDQVPGAGVVTSANAQPDQGETHGPFLSRLKQFSELIRRDLGAKAMFLIDNEGQILLDEVENTKLIQVARTLANASYRASRQTAGAGAVGNLHVKISASATLEVVPVESRYGLLILGVIFPAPIGAARVIQLAEELFRTVEPHY